MKVTNRKNAILSTFIMGVINFGGGSALADLPVELPATSHFTEKTVVVDSIDAASDKTEITPVSIENNLKSLATSFETASVTPVTVSAPVNTYSTPAYNSVMINGQTFYLSYTADTTVDAGGGVLSLQGYGHSKFLYGNNNIIGGAVWSSGVGSVISVTENGQTISYLVTSIVNQRKGDILMRSLVYRGANELVLMTCGRDTNAYNHASDSSSRDIVYAIQM